MNHNPQKNARSWKVPASLLVGSLTFLLTQGLFAQEAAAPVPAPAPEAAAAPAEDEFELDVFEVNESGDYGYRKTGMVTATKIGAEIKDVPLSVSIVSEEFMKDTGVQNLVDAFNYSSGISANPDSLLRNDGIFIRGFQAGFVLRNGYKKYYTVSLDAVDRVEVVKGPISAFYGLAEPSGVINYITKKPLFTPFSEVKVEVGSYDRFKVGVDVTAPIKKDVLAFRAIGTYEDSDSWRDYVNWERKYAFGALKWNVNKKISLDASYDYDDSYRTGGVNTALIGDPVRYEEYYQYQGKRYGYDVRQVGNAGGIDYRESWDPAKYNIQPLGRTPRDNIRVRYPEYYTRNVGTGVAPVYVATLYPDPSGSGYQNPRLASGLVSSPYQTYHLPFYAKNSVSIDDTPQNLANNYKRGLQAQRFIDTMQAGNPEVRPQNVGYYFPRGYNYNPNGEFAYNEDISHNANAELTANINENFSFRFGGNYSETTSEGLQQYNSDTDDDGYTLDPAQGFGMPPGVVFSNPENALRDVAGAMGNTFSNKYYSNIADLTYRVDVAGTKQTFIATGEYKSDRFKQYAHAFDGNSLFYRDAIVTDRPIDPNTGYPLQPPGTPPPAVPTRDFLPRPGVGVVDLFNDAIPNYASWVNRRRITIDEDNQYNAWSLGYRGQYFSDALNIFSTFREDRRLTEAVPYVISSGQNQPKAPESKDTGALNSWMLGANYRLPGALKDFSIYSSYSESYALNGNSVRYTYQTPNGPYDPNNNSNTTSVTGDVAGQQSGLSYEFGVKTDFKDNLINGSMALYHIERNDLPGTDTALRDSVYQDYEELGWPADQIPAGMNFAALTGSETSEGVEADAIITPSKNWQITVGGSYIFTRDRLASESEIYGNKDYAPGSTDGPALHPSLFVYDQNIQQYEFQVDQDPANLALPVNQQNGNWALVNGGYRPKTRNEIEAALANTDPSDDPVYLAKQSTTLINVPEWQGYIWTKYDFSEMLFKGFSAGIGANYKSEMVLYPDLTRDGFTSSDMVIFDALVRYTITMGSTRPITAEFSLNVKNMFDTRGNSGGNFGINDPRQFILTTAFRF